MTDKKISEFDPADDLAGDEALAGVQSGNDAKITPEQLRVYGRGRTTLPAQTEPFSFVIPESAVAESLYIKNTTVNPIVDGLFFAKIDGFAGTVSDLVPKVYVKAISLLNLSGDYDNGTAGVGATLTNNGTQAALSIDQSEFDSAPYEPENGERIALGAQTGSSENGIWVVTDKGSVITDWVLTRATDYDEAADVALGDYFTILNDITGGFSYVQVDEGPFVIGTTAISFERIEELGSINIDASQEAFYSYSSFISFSNALSDASFNNSGDDVTVYVIPHNNGSSEDLPSFNGASLDVKISIDQVG